MEKNDGRLLIVNGNLTLLWDGELFSKFSGALIGGKIISRNAGRAWIDSEKLIEEVNNMDRDRARKIVHELISLIEQWGFSGAFDVELVSGFLLAQMVQSVWDWRPHLWVSGRHGSGKTLLLTLFEEIGGRLARRFEGSSTTEAGFRQSVKQDNCLISFDEFEKSQSREQILSYLRTAGRGGVIAKGSPGQESVEYSLKHMVLCASIESGLARAAEKTRFIPIETKKDPDRDPHLPGVRELEGLRIRLFSLAIWGALIARRRIRELKRIPECDARLMEAYAVPLAMVTIADDNPQYSLQKQLEKVLLDREKSGRDSIPEDEDRLLDDILASTTRVDVDSDGRTLSLDRSIGWLLQSQSQLHRQALETVGIKPFADGVFLACSLIERQLLKDTIWKGMNIMSILRRLPGAERVKKRIAGRQPYGVLFSKMEDLLSSKSEGDDEENELLFT